MPTTSVYIKSLELGNIRTFGKGEVLICERSDGSIPQWTLILGDNGIGKSTLLQCIAWMKPYLPYETKEDVDFEPQPIINDEENETLVRLVRRNNATSGEQSANIRTVFVANKNLNKTQSSKLASTCETNITIALSNGKLIDVESNVHAERINDFYDDEVLIYGYSASRQLGKLNVDDPEMGDTIPSFIAENTMLYDAEEILHTSNYAALGSTGEEKKQYKNYINKIKQMLVSLLPDVETIRDIEILTPKLLGKHKRQSQILITTKYGKKIPFSDASLGYKTAASWTIDLAWRLFLKYRDSSNPLAEPAIVLIDEIDLHLHPVWQRQIMSSLSNHFKNTQFIATAHSPLMVQAAIELNYAVLKQGEKGVTILNDPTAIDGWRVDQILTSEMFGLESSRGIKYEELYRQYERLSNEKLLRTEEKAELKTVTEQLSKLPTGENPEEIENRKLISEVALEIKKRKRKIDL